MGFHRNCDRGTRGELKLMASRLTCSALDTFGLSSSGSSSKRSPISSSSLAATFFTVEVVSFPSAAEIGPVGTGDPNKA